MKRQLLPLLVILGGLAAVLVVVVLFSSEASAPRAEAAFDEARLASFAAGRSFSSSAPASDVRAHGTTAKWSPSARSVDAYPPPYPVENVSLHVNYAYDTLEGNAEQAGVTVAITVTAFDDSPKANAVVSTESDGYFSVTCPDWLAGECPDFVPGDKVKARAEAVTAEINPIGHISGRLDEATDSVSGTLLAPGQSGQLNVTCQVLTDPGSVAISKTADANGGAFSCDFLNEAGWDLQWDDQVALTYEEDDGDLVTNVPPWAWARVNYGHEWVGMNYDLGHTFLLTVTDGNAVKGTAEVNTISGGGWAGPGFQSEPGQWTPAEPDIMPGDWVHFAADDGYRNSVQVGTITGALDADADRLDGQVLAPHFAVSLTVECHPWGAWDLGIDAPIKVSWAEPDGSVPFACQWGPGEWDVQPGQEAAAMYLEPDKDRVINVFQAAGPPPELQIDKSVEGSRVAGTIVTYTLTVSNVSDIAASGLVITDQLPSNVTWINGGIYDDASGIITWQWPNLPASETVALQFSGRLGCSGQVVNDRYRVAESDQGVSSPWGEALSFSIVEPSISAGFNQSASDIKPGETVFFTNTSTTNGRSLTNFNWDFDDGQNGSGAAVSHVFAAPGQYTVVLTAAEGCGYQDTASGTVQVLHMSLLPIITVP
jgi:uncharacterized repeat protein (TIGR01451 family)